jgi:ADP-ribosylglycohydrolase
MRPKLEDHNKRIALARKSLDGLSLGDAFGQRFFGNPESAARKIAARSFPTGILRYTDDTVMALSIVDVLNQFGYIEQNELAKLFAIRFKKDPMRGYGGAAFDILERIGEGEQWQGASREAFEGNGSMGNGAAMRSGPIGAYYYGNKRLTAENARLSAEVTHAHNEGQAGAIAVAMAACHFASGGNEIDLFDAVLEFMPSSETKDGIQQAAKIRSVENAGIAVRRLGSGSKVLSQDTVPFCIWCASRSARDFKDALWTTVAGLGDRDTTCAIVGSIVASKNEIEIPIDWFTARETFDGARRYIYGDGIQANWQGRQQTPYHGFGGVK